MATLRYFGAAQAAAGTASEVVEASTLAELLDAARAAHGAEFARVLTRCTTLVDGRAGTGPEPVGASTTVDVLPPFAGG